MGDRQMMRKLVSHPSKTRRVGQPFQLSENNGEQADSMGRKALALATGDPQAQSASWRLIADSLRLLHRNGEAAEADQKAAGLAASFLNR